MFYAYLLSRESAFSFNSHLLSFGFSVSSVYFFRLLMLLSMTLQAQKKACTALAVKEVLAKPKQKTENKRTP